MFSNIKHNVVKYNYSGIMKTKHNGKLFDKVYQYCLIKMISNSKKKGLGKKIRSDRLKNNQIVHME